MLVRAWTYIRSLGAEGLREVSEMAVLNANYVMEGLRGLLDLPYGDRRCMHEFVGSATPLEAGRRARPGRRQAAARLRRAPADHVLPAHRGRGADGRADGDRVARTRWTGWSRRSSSVAREAGEQPELLHEAPVTLPVRRLDEAQAARRPVVKQVFAEDAEGGA